MSILEQLVAIDRVFPEIAIVRVGDKYKWCFRCIDSDDRYKHGLHDSPLEALAHYAKVTTEALDNAYNDDDE